MVQMRSRNMSTSLQDAGKRLAMACRLATRLKIRPQAASMNSLFTFGKLRAAVERALSSITK